MGVNLTRQSLGWTMVSALLLLFLFWSRSALYPVELTPAHVDGMPLGDALEGLAASYPVPALAAVLVLVLVNAILITSIVTRNMIYTDKVFMPAVVYIAVSCGIMLGANNIVAVTVSWLLVCASNIIIISFRRQKIYGQMFTASILLGTALLLYAPATVFALMLPVSLVVFRKDWHETLIAVIGYILPFTICSYVYWGMGEPFAYLGERLCDVIMQSCRYGANFPVDFVRPDILAFWGITALTALASVFIFFSRASLMRTRPYKSIVFFIWLLAASAALFIAPSRSIADFAIIAIPLAVIMPAFFNRHDGWLTNIAYLIFIVSITLFNLLPFIADR